MTWLLTDKLVLVTHIFIHPIIISGIVVSYVFYQYVDYPGQGFFCDDKTLQYPYKKSVISNTALFTTLIGIPTITVSLDTHTW